MWYEWGCIDATELSYECIYAMRQQNSSGKWCAVPHAINDLFESMLAAHFQFFYLSCLYSEKKSHGARSVKSGSGFICPTAEKIEKIQRKALLLDAQNKGLNMAPITTSYNNCNLSSVFPDCPSSWLPSSWKLL